MAEQEQAPRKYTVAEMPKVMEATWNDNVINNDIEKEVILSLLKRGQLIIINQHSKKTKWLVTGGMLANARPETLFKVITDMPNYSKFMPMTEGAKATPLGDPNIVDLNLTLKLKVVKMIPAIPMNFSVLHYHRPPYRSDWTYLNGNFERNDGYYQFVPVGDGSQTMIFYTLYSLVRIPLVKNMFANDPNLELVMNMSTAAMVTRALKNRAELVEKRPPFVPGKGMTGAAMDVITKDTNTIKLLLSRGGLVLIEEGPPMWATTVVSMNVAPQSAFDFITKFVDYPCYQSQVSEVKVNSKTGTAANVGFKLSLDYAILKIPLSYQLAYSFAAPQKIEWKWASGDMPTQQGSWNLFPLEGGKKTLAIFRQTEDLKSLPGVTGAGLKASIEGQPSLEPAILGSQALIVAASSRDFVELSPQARQTKSAKCSGGK